MTHCVTIPLECCKDILERSDGSYSAIDLLAHAAMHFKSHDEDMDWVLEHSQAFMFRMGAAFNAMKRPQYSRFIYKDSDGFMNMNTSLICAFMTIPAKKKGKKVYFDDEDVNKALLMQNEAEGNS